MIAINIAEHVLKGQFSESSLKGLLTTGCCPGVWTALTSPGAPEDWLPLRVGLRWSVLRMRRCFVEMLEAASADGYEDDGTPCCSGSPAVWKCHPERSCCWLAPSHDHCPASSCGIPAKTPIAAEGRGSLFKPCCWGTDGLTYARLLAQSHHSPKLHWVTGRPHAPH